MKKILLLVLIIISIPINAQINIQVLDSISLSPMADVNVYSQGLITYTDSEGWFDINEFSKLSENDSLTISFVGYITKKLPINEIVDKKVVYMLFSSKLLKETVIIGNRNKINKEYIYAEKLAPMPDGVYAFGATIIDNKIYVIGGDRSVRSDYYDYYIWKNISNRMQVYDIETNKWQLSDIKFTNRAYHNIHYHNNKIIILGGKCLAPNSKVEYFNKEVEIYNLKTNRVISSKTNPHPAVNFASSLYNDSIIVFGGSIKEEKNRKTFTNKIHLFDLKTGYWYDLGNIPYKIETKSIAVDSIIYQVGGYGKGPVQFIDTYNVLTEEYKLEKKLFYGIERPALAYHDNIIYIHEHGAITTYNILTKELLIYLVPIFPVYSEMIYYEGKLYIIGGRMLDDKGHTRPSTETYSIDLNEFKRVKPYYKWTVNKK